MSLSYFCRECGESVAYGRCPTHPYARMRSVQEPAVIAEYEAAARMRRDAPRRTGSIRGIPVAELSGYHSSERQQMIMLRFGAERYLLARHELRMRYGSDRG